MVQYLFSKIGNILIKQSVADLALGHIKLLMKRYFFVCCNQKIEEKKITIWNYFEMNFARNCVKNRISFWKYSVKNSLICPKAKSATQSIKINIGPLHGWDNPESTKQFSTLWTIILLSHRSTTSYWRLSDLLPNKPLKAVMQHSCRKTHNIFFSGGLTAF